VNVYAVCIPEERVHYAWDEPPEPGVPLGIFAAETAGQAKVDALRTWTHRSMGVNTDDFPAIRARRIGRAHWLTRGEVAESEGFWLSWPEDWPVIER
jgi:hypothetical protein